MCSVSDIEMEHHISTVSKQTYILDYVKAFNFRHPEESFRELFSLTSQIDVKRA